MQPHREEAISSVWKHMLSPPPPPCNPRRGVRTPVLVCSLHNKTARLLLATGGGQICGAQPGGWAPDARWVQATRDRSARKLNPPTPHKLPKDAAGGARDRRPTGFPQPHVRSATSQGLDRPQTLRQQIKTCRRREKWGEGNNKKIVGWQSPPWPPGPPPSPRG